MVLVSQKISFKTTKLSGNYYVYYKELDTSIKIRPSWYIFKPEILMYYLVINYLTLPSTMYKNHIINSDGEARTFKKIKKEGRLEKYTNKYTNWEL
jgi:hypothetical protein